MAEPFEFKKVLDKPGPYGAVYKAVTRPAHSTIRLKYDGVRGEEKRLRAISFFVSQEAAETFYGILEASAGFEVELVSQLDLESYVGVLFRPELLRLRLVGHSDPTLNPAYLLEVAFGFVRTEAFYTEPAS